MASVTTEKRNGRTRYRIEWRDADKRRRKLRLSGDIGNKKDADAIARKVTAIVSANAAEGTLDTAIAEWLAKIGDDLYGKLAESGLVEPRKTATLGDFLSRYIDARKSEVEVRTIGNFEATKAKLTEHFGEDKSLRAITEGDAYDWRQAMFKALTSVTVAGHVKRAKQFFAHASRKRFIESNPFAELVAGSQGSDSRLLFIDRATIDSVIEYAPDAEWRLLIALARYGGLRNPSETLRLKWTDINWAEKRILVTSKKTKRHKPFRTIPLFPELEQYLLDAQEVAKPGAVYCIERYRSQDTNLRTGLQRIIEQASLTPWPRLWQNLRASRETELANEYPIHVVTEWIGNSPAIAAKHYLSVTDTHFTKATQGVGRQVGTSLPETTDLDGNDSQPLNEETHENTASAVIVGFSDFAEYAREDSNL